MTWVVLARRGERGDEARASAEAFLGGAARRRSRCHGFRDRFFPYVGGGGQGVFEELKARSSPISSSPTRATTCTRTTGSSASWPGTRSATT